MAPRPLVEGRIAVLGLGYVGLPTAAMIAVAGARVLGVDVSSEVIDSLLDGNPPTSEAEVKALLNLALHSGKLELSTALESCDAYIVAVPTPVLEDRSADLSYVRAAIRAVSRVVQPGQLVVLESTVPPGTMDDVVMPELAEVGIGPADGVLVAHCPERVLPGATMLELTNNDRVIGGYDTASAQRAAELYALFVKGAIHLTDLKTAEFVKVMENTYRDVNIALANEFAKVAERIGVDVWEAIQLANNHPRVSVLRPGPGVGGHCVAVDPWFLVQLAPDRTPLIHTARIVNDGMPDYVVQQVSQLTAPGAGPIALLGLAYRADIGDTRESPALSLHALLQGAGYEVKVHDPFVEPAAGLPPNLSLTEALAGAAAIVIATDHAPIRALDPAVVAGLTGGRVVFDTRNCLDAARWVAAGFTVRTLGRAG